MTCSHNLHAKLCHIQGVGEDGGENSRKHRGNHGLEEADLLLGLTRFIPLEVRFGIIFHEKTFDMLVKHKVEGRKRAKRPDRRTIGSVETSHTLGL